MLPALNRREVKGGPSNAASELIASLENDDLHNFL